jgi:hypothetical protein
MSAILTGLGVTHVTETGKRASGLAGAFLAESVTSGGTVDLAGTFAVAPGLGASLTALIPLAGGMTPSTLFAGVLNSFAGLGGGISPSVSFAGALSVTSPSANYVDLAGNIGGTSLYGRGKYGAGKYSRSGAVTPTFAATLSGKVDFSGGDLRPSITFAGNLGLQIGLRGGLAPSVAFAGRLGLDVRVVGDLPITVMFAADMISGPLWGSEVPAPPLWTADPGCPASPWSKDDLCDATWTETEMCNG